MGTIEQMHDTQDINGSESVSQRSSASLLADAGRLFSLYLQIPVWVGPREKAPLTQFHQDAAFLDELQPLYQPDYLAQLLRMQEKTAIYLLDDPLGTHTVLMLAGDQAALMGPFVTEGYQEKASRSRLAPFLPLAGSVLLQYKLYWCDLGCCDLEAVLQAAQCMLKYAGMATEELSISHCAPPAKTLHKIDPKEIEQIEKSWAVSAQQIEERYAMESQMMLEIANGHEKAAIEALHHMLHENHPQRGMVLDLWSRDSAMAIMRTLFRISAKRSGLPAVVIDAVSLDYAQRMRQFHGDPVEMTRLYEQMITALCRQARRMQESGYSTLTHKALTFIRAHYAEPMPIRLAAEALKVSESTLSRALRRDTGSTFTELLTQERVKAAASYLLSTAQDVQDICAHVGFDDPNYFVKVFRKTYGMTPSAFRASGRVDPLWAEKKK